MSSWRSTTPHQGSLVPGSAAGRAWNRFLRVGVVPGSAAGRAWHRFEPALVHGDLGPEHLLVREGKLVAVIDWGDARIGDPALDYAWLLHGPFPDWDVDADLRRRARVYHRLGPWFEAHYGLFVKSSEHVRGRLAGIRERLNL